MRDLIASLKLVETTWSALTRVMVLLMLLRAVMAGGPDRADSIVDMTTLERLLGVDAGQGRGCVRLRIRASGVVVEVVTAIHVGCHLQTRRIRLVF